MGSSQDTVIAQRLREAFEESGMSREQLSAECGWDRSYLSKLMKQDHSCSCAIVRDVAQALNVNPAWLAGWSESKNV